MTARDIAAVSPGDWIPLTLASGMSAAGGTYVPAARQWFDQVQLRGAISGTIGTGGVLVATLPAGMAPASNCNGAASIGSGAGQLVISTTGALILIVGSGVTAVHLDGISFTVA